MSEPKLDLLQSLETVLEESRRLRKESGLLLEKAQWPGVEPTPREESSPLIPDLLHIPTPPLPGLQRDRGNLSLGQSTQSLEPNLRNTPPKPETPAGQNPLKETGSELSESRLPDLAGPVNV